MEIYYWVEDDWAEDGWLEYIEDDSGDGLVDYAQFGSTAFLDREKERARIRKQKHKEDNEIIDLVMHFVLHIKDRGY